MQEEKESQKGNKEIKKIPIQAIMLFSAYISTGTTHGGQGSGPLLVLPELELDTTGNPLADD